MNTNRKNRGILGSTLHHSKKETGCSTGFPVWQEKTGIFIKHKNARALLLKVDSYSSNPYPSLPFLDIFLFQRPYPSAFHDGVEGKLHVKSCEASQFPFSFKLPYEKPKKASKCRVDYILCQQKTSDDIHSLVCKYDF